MPDFVQTARAGTAGTATILVQHNKSGIVWVVAQISVESDVVRTGANCVVTRNGRPMTTTSRVPATASGYPFYRLTSADRLEISFTGFVSGDSLVATISYSETLWGEHNDGSVV